eukprot:10028195-Prorocentrum_lima.AAC.1
MFASHGNLPTPIIAGYDGGDFQMGGMQDAASAAGTTFFQGQGQCLGTQSQQSVSYTHLTLPTICSV